MLNGRRIALVEDDPIMGGSIVQRLELEGAEVLWLRQAARALGALRTPRAPVDAVVCDIRLPDGSGETLYATLCDAVTPPPFLFITGQADTAQAVRLLRAGAADYVTKPFEMAVFLDRLRALIAPGVAQREQPLLGVSPLARRVEAQAAQAAAADAPVLIRGGRGAGKARVAQRIHAASDRRAAPFVGVDLARENPAALFGVGGALARTGEGVLFINAIDRLPRGAQEGLATAMNAGFEGRIVCACGDAIEATLAEGRFGRELWRRLAGFEIAIPPLRARPDDAVWLMGRLFPPLNARRAAPLKGVSALTEDAVRAHDWPGEGRELRRRVARGVSAAQGGLLFPADVFPERLAAAPEDAFLSLAEARDAAERAQIRAALERTGGHAGEAARLLKVSRTTLWEKMQKLKP